MITLVVPTRNRAHTLRLVLPSYLQQALITELIVVDDHGDDETASVMSALAHQYPEKRVVLLHNDRRRGAPYSRNRGYRQASNSYILFCDDDEYLETDYAAVCLRKLNESGAAIVSGRRIYKLSDETPEEAIQRFGNGTDDTTPFNKYTYEYHPRARYYGDIKIPLTNSVILTKKDLLEKFNFDEFYARGNGYREESDYQMNVFVNGHDILVTNDVHSIHLSRQECRKGGQRINRLYALYWSIYYTNYFYRKYYDRYAKRVGLRMGRRTALVVFAAYMTYALFIRPFGKMTWLLGAQPVARKIHEGWRI